MRKKQTSVELLFLGSGNAFAPGRAFSSFIVDRNILFEASPTTLPAIRELKIPLEDIRYLFVSHFHADHCFGLPFIFLDHYFVTRRKVPLMIIGPKGIKRLSSDLVDLGFSDTRKRYSKNFPVEFLEAIPGKEYAFKDFSFRAHNMSHGDTTCLGFSLRYKQRTLAYSGDTGPCPALTDMLSDADIAVLEMSSIDGDFPSHLNLQNILDIRKALPSQTKLVLTHLPAMSEKDVKRLTCNPHGTIDLAEDMQRFEFGL